MDKQRQKSALALAVAAAMLVIPVSLLQVPAVRAQVMAGIAFLRETGPVGVAAYYAAYVAGVVVTAPPWLFSGIAGYAYGFPTGVLVASTANLTATTTAFLVGRFLARRRLEGWLAKSPRWVAIKAAVEANALRVALLVRISPVIPQNFMNYAFSLTRMPLRTYMAATWVGLLPVTTFQVYVGSLVHDAEDLVSGKRPPLGATGWIATGSGIVVSLVALATLARIAQKALAKTGVLGPATAH